MIASGDLNTGKLLTVMWAVVFGAMALGSIGPRMAAFAKAIAASQEIFQTIRRTPSIDSLDKGGHKPSNIRGTFEFRNVSFIYPSRPQGNAPLQILNPVVVVLKNVSMHIPEGKFTAIVGLSGSGKSTIVQLLERFYDPVEGEILLDGYNIKDLNVKFLRSCMGLVSQEPTLFGLTVFENVCHGYA